MSRCSGTASSTGRAVGRVSRSSCCSTASRRPPTPIASSSLCFPAGTTSSRRTISVQGSATDRVPARSPIASTCSPSTSPASSRPWASASTSSTCRTSGRRIQIQLLQDYQTNIDAYATWQAFLRKQQPPTLIVWGKNDQAFLPAGAEAYLRDLPNAELQLLGAGHFAVEEQAVPIAKYMIRFMDRLPPDPDQTRARAGGPESRFAAITKS